MGNFYSAGRDPIFYSHHANVDRTWSIWKSLSINNKDFTDKDFLNTYFYFYDENAQPVKIYVRDVLDTKKMGYDYQPQDLPWLKSKPTPKRNRLPKPLKKVFSTVKNVVIEYCKKHVESTAAKSSSTEDSCSSTANTSTNEELKKWDSEF
ncbi:(+)-larreatricin hydroxylase, chloroplastic-like [Beta vulgaris subsp. vulgaris]|uniref:(+)-larreatricin hydroxylase, chloroplastic-like n=1 Tax=Beta vulgaris subsp. vulgaris TaxID=3555 RepID=UPI002037029B|nr:(+)-larreatricin hydroxylase, chloroplastic-like [Beta vulgaris subsp. vulgaris]